MNEFFKGIERDEMIIFLASLAFPWVKDFLGKGKLSGAAGKGGAVSSITAAMGGLGGNDEDLLLYLFGEIKDKKKAKILHELSAKLTPTAIRSLRLRLTSLPGNHSPLAEGEKGEKKDSRLSTLEGLIALCEENGVDDTVKLLTEYGIVVQDPQAVKWIKKLCDIDASDELTFGLVVDKMSGPMEKLRKWLKDEDQEPVPMGPIRYIINSVLAGGDKAELVLIPRWVKNLVPKFSRSKPRRPPLEYHDRIPPTL